MVDGIASVWVPVVDVDRAIDFYGTTLGLDVEKHDGDWAEVDANGLMIGLNENEDEGAGVGGGPVIAFQPSEGIEAAVNDLRSKGLEIAADISDHPWGRIATFKDSEGNDLQLYAPPGA